MAFYSELLGEEINPPGFDNEEQMIHTAIALYNGASYEQAGKMYGDRSLWRSFYDASSIKDLTFEVFKQEIKKDFENGQLDKNKKFSDSRLQSCYNSAYFTLEKESLFYDYGQKMQNLFDSEHNKYHDQEERKMYSLINILWYDLVSRVNSFLLDDDIETEEEACQAVINNTNWNPFYVNLFMHAFYKDNHRTGERIDDFIVGFQDFMNNKAPELLLEAWRTKDSKSKYIGKYVIEEHF